MIYYNNKNKEDRIIARPKKRKEQKKTRSQLDSGCNSETIVMLKYPINHKQSGKIIIQP